MKKIILLSTLFFYLAIIGYAQHAGDLDPSFGANGIVTVNLGPNTSLTNLATQSDGKIIVSGNTVTVKGDHEESHYFLVRFNPDGSPDNTFHGDPLQFASTAIAIQADGKILVAGSVQSGSYPDVFYSSALTRHNIDGSLDNSFSEDGIQYNDFGISSLAIQTDGKIVVAGSIQVADDYYGYHNNFAIARYNSDGSADDGFSEDGKQTTEFTTSYGSPINTANYSLAIQTDGKILMSGRELIDNFDSYGGWIVRYNIDGSVDRIKHIWIGDKAYISSMALGDNNKIVIYGNLWNPYDKFGFLFTLDPTDWETKLSYDQFETSVLPFADYRLTLENNGKIIITGPIIARFNATGGFDNTFSGDGIQTPPGGNSVADVVLANNKMYVVAGNLLARYLLKDNIDNEPPSITNVTADPASLWPPNHQLHKVTISYDVKDNHGFHSPTLSVSSNNGNSKDWVILDNHHVQLRAEKGKGNKERVYTIEIKVTDLAGNKSIKTINVSVSKNSKKTKVSAAHRSAIIEQENVQGLTLKVTPNPTANYFTLFTKSESNKPVQVRVTDLLGKVIETRINVAANGKIQLGSNYRQGIYFVQVIQGTNLQLLKLIKQ